MIELATNWNVDWAQASCSLRRSFGSLDNPDIISFERYGSTENFQLTIVIDRLNPADTGPNLAIKFGDGERFPISSAMIGKTKNGKLSIVVSATSLGGSPLKSGSGLTWPKLAPEQQTAITSLTVVYGPHSAIFHTGPLNKPFAALRECTDGLVESWGLDPAQQSNLSKPVMLRGAGQVWVTDRDYPAAALASRASGTVHFRLMIDAQGNPTSCAVPRSYTDKTLDEATCRLLLKRGRFLPALDQQGDPVPSYYINAVDWILPQ